MQRYPCSPREHHLVFPRIRTQRPPVAEHHNLWLPWLLQFGAVYEHALSSLARLAPQFSLGVRKIKARVIPKPYLRDSGLVGPACHPNRTAALFRGSDRRDRESNLMRLSVRRISAALLSCTVHRPQAPSPDYPQQHPRSASHLRALSLHLEHDRPHRLRSSRVLNVHVRYSINPARVRREHPHRLRIVIFLNRSAALCPFLRSHLDKHPVTHRFPYDLRLVPRAHYRPIVSVH